MTEAVTVEAGLPDSMVLYPYVLTRDEKVLEQIADFFEQFDALKPGDRISGSNFMGFLRHEVSLSLKHCIQRSTTIEGKRISEEEYKILGFLFMRLGHPMPGGMHIPQELRDAREAMDEAGAFSSLHDLYRKDGLGGVTVGIASGAKGEIRRLYLLAQWATAKEHLVVDLKHIAIMTQEANVNLKKRSEQKIKNGRWWFLSYLLVFVTTAGLMMLFVQDTVALACMLIADFLVFYFLSNRKLGDALGHSAATREYKASQGDRLYS